MDEDNELSEESKAIREEVWRDYQLFKKTGIRPDYAPKEYEED